MFEDSIKKIDVKKINFSLDPNKPDRISLDSDAEVHFNVPRFTKIIKPTIESLSLEGRVSDQDGNFIAPIIIPNHYVGTGLSSQNSLNTKMNLDINVNHLNIENVESLLAEILYSQDTTISISGHSSVRTRMFFGKVNVPRVPFSAEIKLPGLGRILSSQEPEIKFLKLEKVQNDEIIFKAKLSINNPTEITNEMGWIQMNLMAEIDHEKLGTVLMENVSIYPGPNEIDIKIFLSQKCTEFTQKLIQNGEERIILQGVPRSELIHPILKNVIGSFVMKGKIFSTFGIFFSSITLKQHQVNLKPEVFLCLNNPFPIPIRILSIKNLRVITKKEKEEILLLNADQIILEKIIIIPAHAENWIDKENRLNFHIEEDALLFLKGVEKKYVQIRIKALIESEIAGMKLELPITKDEFPLYIELN